MFAFDIDGTLADFLGAAVPAFNQIWGRTVSLDQAYHAYDLATTFHVSPEAVGAALDRLGPTIYGAARPYERAISATRVWARRDPHMVYLTTRPVDTHDVTRLWLRQSGFPVAPLVHVARHDEKIQWVLAHSDQSDVGYLIDDHPDVWHAAQAVSDRVIVWLVRQPYNAEVPAERWLSWSPYAVRSELARVPIGA